ncbi:unnamed protein product [Caenorhabditis angaria]|uniref:Uncharacterized protein n=1 Tax=Caenorhabditis angaria TaxID=860376 RepID=A0A9P1IJW6_9PELO|nr:unnamed protein product [Caenorhabditis angaria]
MQFSTDPQTVLISQHRVIELLWHSSAQIIIRPIKIVKSMDCLPIIHLRTMKSLGIHQIMKNIRAKIIIVINFHFILYFNTQKRDKIMEQHVTDVISIDLKIQISKQNGMSKLKNYNCYRFPFHFSYVLTPKKEKYYDSWCMFGRFSKICKNYWTKHVLKNKRSVRIGAISTKNVGYSKNFELFCIFCEVIN